MPKDLDTLDSGKIALSALAYVNPEPVPSSQPADLPFLYIDLGSVSQGNIDWLKISMVTKRTAPTRAQRLARPLDVLFGTVRPALQSHCIVPRDAEELLVASTGFAVIRARSGIASPEFLYHYCLSAPFYGEARRAEVGSNYPAVNEHDIAQFRVLNLPFNEQTSIAVILDTIDAALRRTEQLVAKLKLAKQGLLHDLLTRGINDNGELRDPLQRSEHFKDSPLGLIPVLWNVQPLGSFVPHAVYGGSQALSAGPGIPVLRMNNIKDGEAELTELKFSDHPCYQRLLLRSGDVLFNRTNSLEHVGRTGIWRGQLDVASFASYLVRLDPDPTQLTGGFLNRLLNWSDTQTRIRRVATPGVQQVNINPSNLRRTMVAVPASINEQTEIVKRLDAFDKGIRSEDLALTKLRLLKQALMDDLLTGRVRVTPLLEKDSPP
jgi:type I restriction enzyme S subunit